MPQRLMGNKWQTPDVEKAAKAAFGYYIALQRNAEIIAAIVPQNPS
ncbi:hypothetical protein GCM10022405_03140 [Gibbsiella dentisursi]|uniref:Uncharacterized protein n=1 Tax=Gibbsiella dentisursi TaxID=796890 RepID=A0ABP7KKT3_9GAMM